jgi:two-component system response regulator YesN
VKKVLIVDDEPLIRSGLSKALKGVAVVHTADSGKQASARVNSSFYDICIVDVALHDASGIDIMHEIKKKSPKTKVVIMTAYADEATREIIGREADRLIEKPLDLTQLREIIG